MYGLHTGSAIATRFTARYPDRVLALVANGTLIKVPEERADLLAHYLPRLVPRWDGSHLAWAWARMREQLIFFPWHKRDPLARVAIPMTLESLQINTLALLQAGDNYRTAYRTAFSYAVEDDLPHIQPPARFICAESDVLVRYLERFPPLQPKAEITRVTSPEEAFQVTQAIFREMVQGETPAPVTTARRAFRLTSSMASLSGGQLHVRENLDGASRPVLILHDIGGSCRALDAVAGGFIGRRPVFAADLPGHGDSDPVPAGDDALIDRLAAALADLIAQRGLSGIDLVAMGDSAAIALALVERAPAVISSLSLCNPTVTPDDRIAEFEREAVPALSPDWAGGHLLTAWHCARDQDLFWPWFDKSGGATLDQGLPASEAIVQQRVIDLFKSEAIHSELSKAIVNDRLVDRIRRSTITPMLFISSDRPVCGAIAAVISPITLGMSQAGWAPRILDALDHD